MTYDERESSTHDGQPVELYLFSCGPQVWAYTSADLTVNHSDQQYVPETISRGSIDLNGEDEQGNLEITVTRTNPIAELFIADLPIHPVYLMIQRYHRGDAEFVVFWTGEISACEFKGSKATLTGLPISRALRRTIPGLTYQGQCNWALFSGQCGLVKAGYLCTATISYVEGVIIISPDFGAHASGYFRSGWVEKADGETHWITAHEGGVLTLMTPFRSLHIGDTVYAYPGCDRTLAACKAFDNLTHFCGFPFIPTKNPFVVGIG